MVDSSRRSAPLTRGAAVLLSSYVGTNALGLLSGIALARALGPEQRGVMQYAVLYFSLAPLVLGLSLGTVFASYGRGTAVPLRGYWRFALVASAVASAGSLLLMSAGLPVVAAVVMAAGSLAYMTSDALVGLATRSGRFGAIARIRWLNLGGNSVIVIVLFAADALTVTSGVITLVATTVIVTGIEWTRQPRPGQQSRLWDDRRHITHVHGVRVAATGSSYLDQVLVAVFLSSATLGVFTVAVNLARQISIIPAAFQTVLLEAARRDSDDGRRRLDPLLAMLLWVGLVAAVVTLIFGEPFFATVFGEEFRAAGTYAAALILTGSLAGGLALVEAYLTGMHQPGVALRARVWSLPLAAVATVVAAATGSVWAIITLTGLMNVVPLIVCFRHLAAEGRVSLVHSLRPPRPRRAWHALRGRTT